LQIRSKNPHTQAWLAWSLLLLVVAIAELQPGDSAAMEAISRLDIHDKLLHTIAYLVVVFVPARKLSLTSLAVCMATTECVGALLELAQDLVPGRSFDAYDLAANTIGVLMGSFLGLASRLDGRAHADAAQAEAWRHRVLRVIRYPIHKD
jgi:VanZ family protein